VCSSFFIVEENIGCIGVLRNKLLQQHNVDIAVQFFEQTIGLLLGDAAYRSWAALGIMEAIDFHRIADYRCSFDIDSWDCEGEIFGWKNLVDVSELYANVVLFVETRGVGGVLCVADTGDHLSTRTK
jgi:hypothetical protein